jgi:Skp family chaperone for outer membrane proteins
MSQSQQDSVEQSLIKLLDGEVKEYFHPTDGQKVLVAKLQQLMVEAKLEQAKNDISNSTTGISNDIDYLKAQLTHSAIEEADTTRKEA